MKRILLVAVLIISSCKSEEKEVVEELKIYDFDTLEPLLNKIDDKVYVINFWATWCAPCVKELPYFEELNANYKSQKVEVVLVSLDFPKQYEKKLKPYIVKNNLMSQVIALDDTDTNTWIPKVDTDWSGAIPATIIYNKNKRRFYERSFNYEELQEEVKTFLN